MLTLTKSSARLRTNKEVIKYHKQPLGSFEMARFVEQFTIPAFLVDSELSVKGMNELAYRVASEGEVIALSDGALHCCDDLTTARLRSLISDMGDLAARDKKEALVLRRSSTGRALHVWGMLLGGETRKDHKLALLFLIDPDIAPAVPTPILQSVYGFTKAESRLVEALLNGSTLESFAEQTNVSVNTARTHLKSVYLKTETNRQPELIRLLAQFMCNVNFIAQQFSAGVFRDSAFQH